MKPSKDSKYLVCEHLSSKQLMFVLLKSFLAILLRYYFNFFSKTGVLVYLCASIHLIFDLVLTTCVGIFRDYYEVSKGAKMSKNVLFGLIFSS